MRQDYCCLILGFVGLWMTPDNYVGAQDVRLVGGGTPFDGRVEIDVNGWRLMCDTYLHINVATTVCRQLGYPVTNVTLKNKSIREWERWITCKEDDADIYQCGWAIWPDYQCKPEESLGIACNGNVRLEDGTNSMNGNLATYNDGGMIMLCDHDADSRIATVVCRQLGMTTKAVTVTTGSYFGKGKSNKYYPKCNGDESSVEDCLLIEYTGSESCDEDHVLGVDCNATIYEVEMVDPERFPLEGGRLNILYDVNAYWKQRVPKFESHQYKSLQNIASVICGMLGFSRNSPDVFWVQSERQFYEFPIALSEGLRCTGSEDSLSNCAIVGHFSSVEKNTTTSTELAVKCLPRIRLVNDDMNVHIHGLDNGVLVLQNESTNDLHPLSDVYMDYRTAKVACYELGFSRNNVELKLVPASIEILLTAVRIEFVCTGEEKQLRDCQSKTSTTVRSDAIVWLNCNYKEDYVVYMQGAYPALLVKHVHGDADQSFCTTKSDLDDSITAGVICHQNGFSRFGARFMQLSKTNNTSVFDDISRFACLGLEEDIQECPKYGKEPLKEQCVYDVGVQCQDTMSCRDSVEVIPKREITCYKSYCQGDTCSLNQHLLDNVTETCSVADGYACLRFEARQRTSIPMQFKTIALDAFCIENCMAYYHIVAHFHLDIRECCYDDGCNAAHHEIQQKGRFRLTSGVMSGEGLVEVYSLSERDWVVIEDDDRLTQHTLVNICVAAGHTSPQYVARSPDQFPTNNWEELFNCMSVDPDVCNRDIYAPDCISSRKVCALGQRLRLSCNAQSPVRVQDGGTPHKGRVEIYFNNKWGTVCMQQHSASVDVVICRSLGFHGYCNMNAPSDGTHIRFRKGRGQIHVSNVNCTGTETHILQCGYNIVNESSGCTHENDLGIVCDNNYPSYESNHDADVSSKISNGSGFQPIPDRPFVADDLPTNETRQCYVGSCMYLASCGHMFNETFCTLLDGTFCYVEFGTGEVVTGTSNIIIGCSSTCNFEKQICCNEPLCNNQTMMISALFLELDTNQNGRNGTGQDNYLTFQNGSGSRSIKCAIFHWVELMIMSALTARLYAGN